MMKLLSALVQMRGLGCAYLFLGNIDARHAFAEIDQAARLESRYVSSIARRLLQPNGRDPCVHEGREIQKGINCEAQASPNRD
jgi:hypothetical protein